jgi:AcrR family transcriptional regulator
MQYLSQRLAAEPARTRESQPPRGTLATSQRARILDATEALIAEKGSAGTTIEAIVKTAGVSSVTFYEHFRDKGACFAAAFDRAVEETLASVGAAAPAELPWPERMRAGMAALLGAIEAEPARARLCLVEAQMGEAQLRARYEATLERAMAALREGRTQGSASPQLPETLEEASAGGLAWLLRERLELGGGGGMEDLLPRMVDIALSPYLGDGALQPLPATGDG